MYKYLILCTLLALACGREIAKRQSTSLCTAGAFYCGNELGKMGYGNTLFTGIYKCSDDNEGYFLNQCEQNGCTTLEGAGNYGSFCPCSADMDYCGYELDMMNFHFDGIDDHTLYTCDKTRNHVVAPKERCSNGCVRVDSPTEDSYCRTTQAEACGVGMKYCGYELGIKSDNVDFEPHSLYRCEANGSGSPMNDCPNGCIDVDGGDSYCDTTARKAEKP